MQDCGKWPHEKTLLYRAVKVTRDSSSKHLNGFAVRPSNYHLISHSFNPLIIALTSFTVMSASSSSLLISVDFWEIIHFCSSPHVWWILLLKWFLHSSMLIVSVDWVLLFFVANARSFQNFFGLFLLHGVPQHITKANVLVSFLHMNN